MGPNLTSEQYRLIFTCVRRYQFDRTILNSKEYQECNEVLDAIFDYAYTQNLEQPT